MFEGFFMFGQLTQNCAPLKMKFGQISTFHQIIIYLSSLRLFQ